LEGQGPVNPIAVDDFLAGGFGESVACVNCSIVNGKLGLSAHHGIHGNLPKNLLVNEVVFDKYEVAAIAINGASESKFNKLNALGQFDEVKVQASFSASIFQTRVVTGMLKFSILLNLKTKMMINSKFYLYIYFNNVI
jgi:hypothetical protein